MESSDQYLVTRSRRMKQRLKQKQNTWGASEKSSFKSLYQVGEYSLSNIVKTFVETIDRWGQNYFNGKEVSAICHFQRLLVEECE